MPMTPARWIRTHGTIIQQKLDRLDDTFIYKESIDLGTYERQRDRLREELRGASCCRVPRISGYTGEHEGEQAFARGVPPGFAPPPPGTDCATRRSDPDGISEADRCVFRSAFPPGFRLLLRNG
jgi:hypothetical protein